MLYMLKLWYVYSVDYFQSTVDKYPIHIQRWMRPFLERCEAKEGGSFQTLISEYLKLMAVNDLQLVFKVFECSKTDQQVSWTDACYTLYMHMRILLTLM